MMPHIPASQQVFFGKPWGITPEGKKKSFQLQSTVIFLQAKGHNSKRKQVVNFELELCLAFMDPEEMSVHFLNIDGIVYITFHNSKNKILVVNISRCVIPELNVV